jgi:hypothetical protein
MDDTIRLAWDIGGLCLAALAVILLVCTITADHSPQRYYLGDTQWMEHGYCASIQYNWGTDNTVFCSNDVDKALDVIGKANTQLHKK